MITTEQCVELTERVDILFGELVDKGIEPNVVACEMIARGYSQILQKDMATCRQQLEQGLKDFTAELQATSG
jgi:hypothetical protein